MNTRRLLRVSAVACCYAALTYASSLALIFLAAMLTGTRARDAFILVFLPGVLLAVLSPLIWRGRRSAMLLALAVAVVVELMIPDGGPLNWRLFLPIPLVFGALAFVGVASTGRAADGGPQPGATVEVFAVLVYFCGILAVFMAPFNHSRNLGWPGVAIYAALVGSVAGGLSASIWWGSIPAMISAAALSLLHWLALAWVDPALWRSAPHILAPAAFGILTLACILSSERVTSGANRG